MQKYMQLSLDGHLPSFFSADQKSKMTFVTVNSGRKVNVKYYRNIPLTSMVYFYNSTEYFPLNQTSTGFYSVVAHQIYNIISWTTRLYFAKINNVNYCSHFNSQLKFLHQMPHNKPNRLQYFQNQLLLHQQPPFSHDLHYQLGRTALRPLKE